MRNLCAVGLMTFRSTAVCQLEWSCPYSCVDVVGALPTKNGDSPGCETKEKHREETETIPPSRSY
jgi:hypothetical protein